MDIVEMESVTTQTGCNWWLRSNESFPHLQFCSKEVLLLEPLHVWQNYNILHWLHWVITNLMRTCIRQCSMEHLTIHNEKALSNILSCDFGNIYIDIYVSQSAFKQSKLSVYWIFNREMSTQVNKYMHEWRFFSYTLY